MARVLNSALQLGTWALLSTALFRCISISRMSVGLHNYSVFQSLFRIWFVGHIGVCPAELSRSFLFILCFIFQVFFIMLCIFVVIVTCVI